MIHALDRNSEYLMGAYLIKYTELQTGVERPQPSQGTFFKCKVVSDYTAQHEYPVKNLSTWGWSVAIETLYNFQKINAQGKNEDYAPRDNDYIYFEGKWYLVDKTVLVPDRKDKSLGLSRLKFSNNKRIIYLVEEATEWQ